MVKGKAPAFQFYIRDWLSDPQLKMASFSTKGIWIDMLCYMWEAPERGTVSGTKEQLARMIGVNGDEFECFIQESQTLKFCDIVTDSHGNVTVKNRRMQREQTKRNNWKKRKQRQREREVVLKKSRPHSSSSSSSSTSNNKKNNKKKGELIPINEVKKKHPWLNVKLWKEFRQHRIELHRKTKKYLYTPLAEKKAINKLKILTKKGFTQEEVINLSIIGGYPGIHEPFKKQEEDFKLGDF